VYSYASRNVLKSVGGITGTGDDAQYRRVLEAVTRQIDSYVERTFRIYQATRYFTPTSGAQLLLDADLLAVTSLKTDEDANRTYEVTWATTDYDLMPLNASVDRAPYLEIRTSPLGKYAFPRNIEKSVEIVGKWGYWEDLVTSASTLNGALTSTATTVPVTAGTDFEVLQTIIIDSEQMYVTTIATNNLTVERGVNGTTAASHSSGAAIKVYRYPYEISEATLMQASRLWTRRAAGYSNQVGLTETGIMRPWVGLDMDVRQMLDPYRMLVLA
jgi:hypothetical protein